MFDLLAARFYSFPSSNKIFKLIIKKNKNQYNGVN